MAASRTSQPTEAPSARRILAARQRGAVAVSRDLSGAVGLLAFIVVLTFAAPRGLSHLWGLLRAALAASPAAPGARMALAAQALDVAAVLTLLPLAPVLVTSALGTALQTGGLFSFAAAAPDLGRAFPRAALGRLGGGAILRGMMNGGAKLVALLLVAGVCLDPVFRRLPALAGAAPRTVLLTLGSQARALGLAAATALVAWGIVDAVLTRRRHWLSLMMTRQEAKRERRETEGDPLRKAERLRLHRELGAGLPVDDVREADFVVTDGAGLAVAVRYVAGGLRAPVVCGGGAGVRAATVESIARSAGIPVHLDPVLARALGVVAAGDEIPASSFEAVARLLVP